MWRYDTELHLKMAHFNAYETRDQKDFTLTNHTGNLKLTDFRMEFGLAFCFSGKHINTVHTIKMTYLRTQMSFQSQTPYNGRIKR